MNTRYNRFRVAVMFASLGNVAIDINTQVC
jgi:hypothetical protein